MAKDEPRVTKERPAASIGSRLKESQEQCMVSLTGIILTYNEEIHIERCISTLENVCMDIIVVDSYSTDRTFEISKRMGAKVLQNPFVNQAQQFQWALDNCVIRTDWVLRLDADEVLEPELIDEIEQRLSQLPSKVSGVYLKRRHYFMDRWIRHGDRYPLVLLRIFRPGMAHIEQRWMDEHIIVDEGETLTFDSDFSDRNLNDVQWWSEKHVRYASREALEIIAAKHSIFPPDESLRNKNTISQDRTKRFLKERVYNRFPVLVRPLVYFLYRYVLRLGFLDGKEGAIYHFLQGFWYRVLVDVRVMEFERAIKDCRDSSEIIGKLRSMTGLEITGISDNAK